MTSIGKVSLDRFNDFFKQTELLDMYDTSEDVFEEQSSQRSENGGIFLHNAAFSWNRISGTEPPTPGQFMLKVPGELRFKDGGVNLIIGPT